MDVFVPPDPRFPWKCDSCGLYIFIHKKEAGCPSCTHNCAKFFELPPSLDCKPPIQPEPRVRSCKFLDVTNIGQTKQRRAQTLKEKPPGALRFVCISDTHSRHGALIPDIPAGDVLIHTGDITVCGEADGFQDFSKFLGQLPHKHKIVIAGNHDITLHPEFYQTNFWRYHEKPSELIGPEALLQECIYLQDSFVEIEGIKIYGTPWCAPYHDWAFNLDDTQRQAKWNLIPKDTDILLTHTPPKGRRSSTPKGEDVGDPLLSRKVLEVRPLVHVFGHVHCSYGKLKDAGVMFINAASINESYQPLHAPIVFDILPNIKKD